MKNYLGLVFSLFVLFIGISIVKGNTQALYESAKGPFVKIVISGKPNAQIILPSEPTNLEEHAGSELQQYIHKISGVQIPIIKEGIPLKYSYTFFLGRTIKSFESGIKLTEEKMGRDGFELKSVQKGVIVRGINDLGTLFGVYELLERCFDVRWFMPGEEGEYYPGKETLEIGQINLVFKPSFDVRWVYSGDWSLHQRMNAYVKVGNRNVGINWKWDYHTYGKLLPPGKYYANHPEYFALVNGKRTIRTEKEAQGNQICTSNPEVISEVAKNLIDTLDANPGINIINFCPEDNHRFCECENCRALDESGRDWLGKYANRFAVFNNKIAKIVKEKYPDVLIKVGAYEMYARPPLDVNYNPESNILFQVCHLWFCHNHPLGSNKCRQGITFEPKDKFLPNLEFERILDQWLKLSSHLFVYEYYELSGMRRANLFWPVIHSMRSDIPYYRNKGVEGFFTQTSDDWPRLGVNFYVASKLCWNADLNVDAILDDYFQKFYGSASRPVKEFFITTESAMQNWDKCASYGLQGVDEFGLIGHEIYTPPVLEKMEQNIVLAEGLSLKDQTVSRRVAKLRIAFEEMKKSLKKMAVNYTK